MTREEAARRNTMQNELKRCPFCGGKYTVNLSDSSECSSCVDEPPCDGCNWKKYLIVCNVHLGGCGAASGLYDTKEEAIEAWNRRYGDGLVKREG